MENKEVIEIADDKNGGHFVPKVVLKKSEYLYGVQGSYFKDMTYIDAIIKKIELAKATASRMLKGSFMDVDSNRLNKVMESISFNTLLLKEITEEI